MTPQEIENDHQNLELLRHRLTERLKAIEEEHMKLANESQAIGMLLERITPQHGLGTLAMPSQDQCGEAPRGIDRAEKNSCVPTKAITRSW